ncbi:hypothetical protein DOE73_00080 [Paenibacillus dendritiformis]|nr:hypothetical protein DOE73_00080 [Paenibacillus dendritiformis]
MIGVRGQPRCGGGKTEAGKAAAETATNTAADTAAGTASDIAPGTVANTATDISWTQRRTYWRTYRWDTAWAQRRTYRGYSDARIGGHIGGTQPGHSDGHIVDIATHVLADISVGHSLGTATDISWI